MTLSTQDQSILDQRIHGLVDSALVHEHRARPFGPHSPALVEVLDFLRRNPDPERPRYLLLDLGPAGFTIAARHPVRGAEPIPAGDERFPSRSAAEHAVFCRRLSDYGVEL